MEVPGIRMTCPPPQSHCTARGLLECLELASGRPATRFAKQEGKHVSNQTQLYQAVRQSSGCVYSPAALTTNICSRSAAQQQGIPLEGGCETADSGNPAANSCNGPEILCQQLYITRSARPAKHKGPGQSLVDSPAHGLRSPRLPATSNHRGRGVRPACTVAGAIVWTAAAP